MSLKFRRILYILFILAFLVITPLVSFYAVGYKLNSRLKLQKTGALIIDTKPSGAKIFINGKTRYGLAAKFFWQKDNFIKTPAKIKNLLPGEYTIRLELDNYWPWQKKLAVQPGQATFAETVNLFKNNLPLLLKRGEYTAVSYLSSSPKIATISAAEINLWDDEAGEAYNFRTAASSSFFSSSSTPLWSPDGRQALCGLALFSVDNWQKPAPLDPMVGSDATDLKWSADSSGFYYRKNNSLYYYSLTARSSAAVSLGRDFYDYYPQNNFIFMVFPAGQFAELAVYDNKYKKIRQLNLPNSTYTFFEHKTAWLNLYDPTHGILYLLDPFSDLRPLYDSISHVILAKWVNDNRLLYANDFEVWLYDAGSGQKTLLTRLSREITDIFWHPSNNYVIFTTANSANIIELDNREKRNITEILGLPGIKWPYLNKEGDALYFYAPIGNQAGIYKLAIQ